jgi:DNA-binding NtrC family response regulator
MTAHGSPELREEARRLGAFAVLDKPFEMNELAGIVDVALGRRPT